MCPSYVFFTHKVFFSGIVYKYEDKRIRTCEAIERFSPNNYRAQN
jgi:hypothetical protein